MPIYFGLALLLQVLTLTNILLQTQTLFLLKIAAIQVVLVPNKDLHSVSYNNRPRVVPTLECSFNGKQPVLIYWKEKVDFKLIFPLCSSVLLRLACPLSVDKQWRQWGPPSLLPGTSAVSDAGCCPVIERVTETSEGQNTGVEKLGPYTIFL